MKFFAKQSIVQMQTLHLDKLVEGLSWLGENTPIKHPMSYGLKNVINVVIMNPYKANVNALFYVIKLKYVFINYKD